MKKLFLLLAVLPGIAIAQHGGRKPQDDSWKKIYRSAATKVNNLVHTKMDAKFDYEKSHLIGKAWITLKPHFYPTDSLTLDAKGMEIKKVSLVKGTTTTPLTYDYSNGMELRIKLNKTYKANEQYTVFIDYVSKPNDLKVEGSNAITDAKGLYFINPKGEDKDKPAQIWTQGETEATSVWVPTIDKPNQKTTSEFNLTVPAKFVTLSNGLLTAKKTNTDGTRTDTWKMTQPHAPYLFFMGIGDYAVIKDTYKGKEVSYYVEKEYAPVARRIFGLTPEMMKYYSERLGVEYPWAKYAQIVGRDYVSGAMENTTATLHQESAHQNARELTDGNRWEDVISHELFHHWFGDYVTAESWSNLTVNESFADYGETLWREYKYGKESGDEHIHEDLMTYSSNPSNATKDLVRFYYRDKEDMFDRISYQKGGAILHMLRSYLGDDAFFKGLNVYLTKNKFGTGNAHKLRLAFEEVSGKDLNWFFNQWYFGNGHPLLTVKNTYEISDQRTYVYITQEPMGTDSLKVFKLPIAIDIHNGNSVKRYDVWLKGKDSVFSFPVTSKPDLVNVDANHVLVAEFDYPKTGEEYLFQYRNGKHFVDRSLALDSALSNNTDAAAQSLIIEALKDKNPALRTRAIQGLYNDKTDAITAKIEAIARNDKDRKTKAAAIDYLGSLKDAKYKSIYTAGVKDSSYSVAGASLVALLDVDDAAALALLPELKKDAKGRLESAIDKVEVLTKTDADFQQMYDDFDNANMFAKFNQYETFVLYLSKVNNTENFKKGLDAFVGFRDAIIPFAPQVKEVFNNDLKALKKRKETAKGLDEATKAAHVKLIDDAVGE